MLRRFVGAGLVAAALVLATEGAAFADNCYNASRPSGGLSANPADFTTPVSKGNWVWLPSIGVPLAEWGFLPPGTPGAINTNGNYQNNQGSETWLLANTPYCATGGVVNPGGTARTYTNGIQSGCGAFG